MNAICHGAKVRLLKSIWDDGEDHHPPGWLAMSGEIVEVRSVGNLDGESLVVAHEGRDGGFLIRRGEFELVN